MKVQKSQNNCIGYEKSEFSINKCKTSSLGVSGLM